VSLAVVGCALVHGRALAQTAPGLSLNAGETAAAVTAADGARFNAAFAAQSPFVSIRATHSSEVRRSTNGIGVDQSALAVSAPLPFGFGLAGGLTWQRPLVAGTLGHRVVADAALSFTAMRGLTFGARVRGASAVSSPQLASGDGVSLDLSVLYRPLAWLSLAATSNELLGPRAPALGSIRAVTAGFAVRPAGTDVLTVGVDGTYTEANTGAVRAGVVARLPFGAIRGEAMMDLPSGAWRAAAGLEFAWTQYTLGGGAILGGTLSSLDSPLGFYASAGWDGQRARALPEPAQLVLIRIDDDLGADSLVRLLLRLERFRRDPAVAGIVFAPRAELYGLAGGDELREAFQRLRAAGKHVLCHLDDAANSALLACSAAERTAIDPIASLRTAGIRSTRFFLGDALRELGVRTQFVRIGPWKSAPEQFTRAGSSPEALAQEELLLDSMLGHLVQTLATWRRWTPSRAREVLFAGPYGARQAVERGLLDELATLDDFTRQWTERSGASLVRLRDYVQRASQRWAGGPAIAVLQIHGDIVDGQSQDIPLLGDQVGDRTIAEAIEALASSPRVAAIVLRVDSPGGSASASERMWRAIARAARRKPIVTSIGRNAASGGYYVAVTGREIFAVPTSITGSIGIFFGKADFAPLLARFHVGVETTRRGDRADMDSLFRPFNDDELVVVQDLIRERYNLFLDRVAEGRRWTRARAHSVGEGRVFSGRVGVERGLVDREGGLLAAIERAAELGNLRGDYEILTLPRPDEGIVSLVRSAIGISDPRAPIAQLLGRSEMLRALQWLYAVARTSGGQPMAMTEWPIVAP